VARSSAREPRHTLVSFDPPGERRVDRVLRCQLAGRARIDPLYRWTMGRSTEERGGQAHGLAVLDLGHGSDDTASDGGSVGGGQDPVEEG
jgi:hypothetical protein